MCERERERESRTGKQNQWAGPLAAGSTWRVPGAAVVCVREQEREREMIGAVSGQTFQERVVREVGACATSRFHLVAQAWITCSSESNFCMPLLTDLTMYLPEK